jgi:hypothetical protein
VAATVPPALPEIYPTLTPPSPTFGCPFAPYLFSKILQYQNTNSPRDLELTCPPTTNLSPILIVACKETSSTSSSLTEFKMDFGSQQGGGRACFTCEFSEDISSNPQSAKPFNPKILYLYAPQRIFHSCRHFSSAAITSQCASGKSRTSRCHYMVFDGNTRVRGCEALLAVASIPSRNMFVQCRWGHHLTPTFHVYCILN